MSYFEELWSVGRDEDEHRQQSQEPDIFSIFDNNPELDNSLYNLPPLNAQEEIFFQPQQVPLNPPIVDQALSTPLTPELKQDNLILEQDNLILEGMSGGGSLKVLGIGGAGCNAVNRMIEDNVSGVDFIAINTDVQVLKKSLAKTRIPIGSKLTKGLGAGAKPEIGEKAAIESTEELREHFQNTDMVFITAGMGGGTGTGAAPIIAQVAKEAGCLVVAVVTLPFSFEGSKRQKTAIEGIDKLKDHVDTMLVISNSRIFEIVEKNTSVKDAFKKIDEVLKQAVQGISGIISETAIINVDFNDVKTILSNRGEAIMGIGQAKGDGRALKAAEEALSNPLIENNTFRQAGAMVAKIIGGSDFDMKEFHEAAEAIARFCRPEAEIIMGLDFDENLRDQVRIIIVATDLVRDTPQKPKMITTEQESVVAQPSQMFSTIEDLQNMYAQERPLVQEQNYIDPDEDWGIKPSQTPPKQNPRNQGLGDRRSVNFSLRKEDPQIYHGFDPNEARRSIGEVPSMASDLDTPAFLRRRKKIHGDSSQY